MPLNRPHEEYSAPYDCRMRNMNSFRGSLRALIELKWHGREGVSESKSSTSSAAPFAPKVSLLVTPCLSLGFISLNSPVSTSRLSSVGGILELDDFSVVCDDFALRHLHSK